ncbi:MAG: hypothetical protein ALAOOOJD_01882 [bacterium]|nr:hypothetical protein [bacterium]
MRALSPGFFDQTESKFLEIWFYGAKGRLHVDLGQISEDVIPNGQLNTEDTFGGIRNNILDDGEDLGLDGVKGSDGAANFGLDGGSRDFWDVNNNKQRDWGEPPSDDDWSYTSAGNDYSHINGTENSKNDANEAGGAIRPDTEDINGNGGLDLANNYIAYTFSLDTNNVDVTSKYHKGGRLSGWKLYRIPLADGVKSDGKTNLTAEDLSRIEYVRVWVDSVEDTRGMALSIADISLAGNEWKEIGIVTSETNFKTPQVDQRFEVSVVNNEENPDEYESPPGVQREVDRITFLKSKEQSQVLRVKGAGLRKNEIAVAQKTFYQPLNLVNYNTLKMFVYGPRNLSLSDTVQFFIRFGADTSNFYEFREIVFPQWDAQNNMDIDLIMLAGLKETLPPDSTVAGYETDVVRYRRIRLNQTQELRVRGNPSLTNVRTLVAGIKNLTTKVFVGEIWMDELRVAEVKKDKGIALRMRADLKLADFMTINGEVNRQDADFHNVSQRFGGGDNRTSFTLASSMTFDKLLPEGLGLSIPISMNYTKTDAKPKYIPGTDIQVTNDLPDTTLKKIKSLSDQIGFNVSARRRSRSQNFFIKNTIDNLAGSLSYTKSFMSSSQIDSSRRTAWSGDMSYNLTFGTKNYVEPFKWIGKAPLLGKLTNTKFYYTPQNFSAQVQATTSHDFSRTRLTGSRRGVVSNTNVYTAVSNLRTAMKIVENISVDYSYGFTSDLLQNGRAFRDSLQLAREGKSNFDTLQAKPKQGLLSLLNGDHALVSASQSVGVKYTPNLFSWFNPNFSYNSNYRYSNNIQQGSVGRSAGTNTSLTASSTLRFADLFKIFQRKAPAPTRETPERRRPAPRLPPGQQKPGEVNPEEKEKPPEQPRNLEEAPPAERPAPGDKEQEEKEKKEKTDKKKKEADEDKPRRSLSPLQLFSLFTKFKDVSANFSRNDSYADYALADFGRPDWRYQLGFTRRPGVPQVGGITPPPTTFQRRDNYSFNSGFDISRSFNITVRFDHDQQSNESSTESRTADGKTIINSNKTGSSSDSWLRTSELGVSFLPDVDMPFPEWTVTWNGLERFKLFSKFATNMSVSHGFGGKKTSTWKDKNDAAHVTNEDFSFNFRPLVQVNMTLKNGMTTSFKYSKTTGDRPTYNFIPATGLSEALRNFQSSAITRTSEMSFTMNYSKQSGFKIPLPFLKNKELRNSVDFSVSFLRNASVSAQQRGSREKKDEIEANSTKSWSFRPQMTYSFSNRVRGGARFEIGKTESKLSGTTNIKEIGIDVNISIRGE